MHVLSEITRKSKYHSLQIRDKVENSVVMSCGELVDCCGPCTQKWFQSILRADQGGDTDAEIDPDSLSPVEVKGWMM